MIKVKGKDYITIYPKLTQVTHIEHMQGIIACIQYEDSIEMIKLEPCYRKALMQLCEWIIYREYINCPIKLISMNTTYKTTEYKYMFEEIRREYNI